MNTKQAEELTGISRQNIRYYERQGLLEPARETGNAYRDYSEEDIRRLKLIKMLRMLDMPLKEIENILKEELPLKEAVVRQQENLLKQQKQLQAAIEVCTSIHKDCLLYTSLGQKVTALRRVGVYVPGGTAVYPSSVLMNIMPAKVAGVDEIIMATPPGKDGRVNPTTLVAAKEAGADAVYKVGGAQAIAALAYGTESIPKVDKIVGPGNIYVALAKKAVYGYVSIDSIAGPSEILVLADETANPRYVAADLLSQAEHDELASAILVTTSREPVSYTHLGCKIRSCPYKKYPEPESFSGCLGENPE